MLYEVFTKKSRSLTTSLAFLVAAECVIKSFSDLAVFVQVCNKPLITSSGFSFVPSGASQAQTHLTLHA
jgi:hypothetical protein